MTWRTDWQAREAGHPELHNRIGRRLNDQPDLRDWSGIDPTGMNDSTSALQTAFNASAGYELYTPPGTYLVDGTKGGLSLPSAFTLRCAPGATFQVIPNDQDGYKLLLCQNVSGVRIVGGSFVGERDAHQGETGEYGYGIVISGGSDIRLEGCRFSKCWGDGIILAASGDSTPTRVDIDGVLCDDNRRQGLSIISAVDVTITRSRFLNTSGHAPAAGVDIEPDTSGGLVVRGVRLRDCMMDNNVYGVMIADWDTEGVVIDDIVLAGCTLSNNSDCGLRLLGGTNVKLSQCHAPGNAQRAYDLRSADLDTYTLTDCTP